MELLKGSIKTVRDTADYIVVVYQTKSYYGNVIKYDIESVINDLVDDKLIDCAIKKDYDYNATNPRSAKKMENDKYNIGYRKLIKKGCINFSIMANDDFYMPQEYKKGYKKFLANGYNRSFCRIIRYVYSQNQQEKNSLDNVNKSVFFKINKKLIIGYKKDPSPIIIDRNTGYGKNIGKDYVFNNNELIAHHLSCVRINLEDKFKNSCMTNISFHDRLEKEVTRFKIKTIDVKNDFDINFEEFDKKYRI